MSSYVATQNLGIVYTFNPSAGTVSFANQPNFNPAYVKAITDQTQNAFIYLPGVANFGGTWDSSSTVLTLQAPVSGYSATDLLIIQYDDQSNALTDIVNLLQTQMANVQQSRRLTDLLLSQQAAVAQQSFGGAGFVPVETPSFTGV